ncbi:GGDEF domain-containing protein [Bradyrhizobium sp. SYSU BS000235]|uniref:GGDEF domain-containing protein n=1 Tax=Bradyrhizobium sp. SYSU BS000235 TaxID=3411332 RepID=UPI003C76AEB5
MQVDMLSGLFNRRGFELRALDALARQTTSAPVAMILGDLDHFKSINDRFGHISGDKIIRRFADVLKEKAPRDAIIARLGGEEFAVLLPPGQAIAAHALAEEPRSAFKDVAPGSQHQSNGQLRDRSCTRGRGFAGIDGSCRALHCRAWRADRYNPQRRHDLATRSGRKQSRRQPRINLDQL